MSYSNHNVYDTLSTIGKKYIKLFAICYPNIKDQFYVKINTRSSSYGLITLFTVGILTNFGQKERVPLVDIYSLYKRIITEIKNRYSISFSDDKSNMSKLLKRLVENGYLLRDLEDAPYVSPQRKTNKWYVYMLSPKGQAVFERILSVLDASDKDKPVVRTYLSEKDKKVYEVAAEIDNDIPMYEVVEDFTYFKSEEDYKFIFDWARDKLIVFPYRLNPLSKDLDKYLKAFFDDKSYPFGAVYRNSLFLRVDVHFYFSTAGKYLDYYEEIVNLKRLLKKLEKNDTEDLEEVRKYTEIKLRLQSIYRKILKEHSKGLKDVLYFLDRDLVEDPVRSWVRLSSILSSITYEVLGSNTRFLKEKSVLPVYLIVPTDSKFYDMFGDIMNLCVNMSDKVFILDGTPLFISNSTLMRLGTIYVCPNNHIHWTLPNDPEPSQCPHCNESFVEAKPMKLEVVCMDIAPPHSNQIFKVYVPIDLLYFINLNANIATGFTKLLVINASDYAQDRSKSTVFLAIGYFPLQTKPKITEDVLRVIKEELSKKKTWEILDYFAHHLHNGIIGYDNAKIVALLVAFSQTTKRIRKVTASSNKIRMDASQYDLQYPPAPLYALFIGKPGTGKSSLAKDTLLYANPSFGKYAYVNLSRASPAGLTVTSVLAQGSGRKIYLGVERVAHGTFIVYDEADKPKDPSVLQSIADTMSEGLFTYDKAYASMLRELAITAKILVANDHMNLDETFNTFDELYDYLVNPKNYSKEERAFRGFVANVIDRFDFIVYFPRIYDTVELIKKYLEIINAVEIKEEDIDKVKKIFSAYVHLVRNFSNENNFYITKEAIEALHEYLEFIKQESYSLYKYLSSPRRLITIYKIARTIAAMHFRTEVNVEDIKEAIAFLLYAIVYPFGHTYIKILDYFKEELGIFYKYMEAFANNLKYIDVIVHEHEQEKEANAVVKSRTELVRFTKSLLTTWKNDVIYKTDIVDMVLDRLKSGKLIIKPIKSWNIQQPIEQSIKDEMEKVINKLEHEGVLLYDGPGRYKINRYLL